MRNQNFLIFNVPYNSSIDRALISAVNANTKISYIISGNNIAFIEYQIPEYFINKIIDRLNNTPDDAVEEFVSDLKVVKQRLNLRNKIDE